MEFALDRKLCEGTVLMISDVTSEIIAMLLQNSPFGVFTAIAVWFFYNKSEKEKTTFSPVVDAFKTVMDLNSKMISEQQQALHKIADEISNDREYHRETIKQLFSNNATMTEAIEDLGEKISLLRTTCLLSKEKISNRDE